MDKNIIVFLVTTLFLGHLAFGSTSKADTAVINKWIEKTSTSVYNNGDSANRYVDSILKYSTEINYDFGIYKSHNSKAIIYYMAGNYDESIQEYLKALPYADENVPFQEIRLYSNIGYSLRALGLNDSSMVYTNKACDIAKKHELVDVYQLATLDIASLYMNMGDYTNAIKYFDLVFSYLETSENPEFYIKAHSVLALFYYKIDAFEKSLNSFKNAIEVDKDYDEIDFLGINYTNMGLLYQNVAYDYDTARYYFRKRIGEYRSADAHDKILIANINIGNTFIDNHELDSAMFYYSKVYNNPLLDNYPLFQAAVFTNLGLYYLKNIEFAKARTFLNDGLELSKEYKRTDFQKNAYKHLAVLDSLEGDYEQAYYNYIQFHLCSNALQVEEANKQYRIWEYEKFVVTERYNNDLLVKENENQNQEILISRVIIGIVLLFVVVLMIVIFIVTQTRKRVKVLNISLLKSNKNLENLNQNLKRQKVEMKELLMSKDRFVSILGHDLKNPFSGLLGLLEMFEEDWDEIPDEEKREGIAVLHQSSIQTYQLLEDLLDWGKTQQGIVKAENSTFDAISLLEEVKTVYDLSLRKKDQTLSFEVDKSVMLNTDRKLLSQIVQNLLGNAIKYSYNKGVITISVQKQNNKHIIKVIDNGIGIPKEKIDGLLEMDCNYNRPGTDGEMSTGMGLLLCKEYTSIIGGNITITSQEGEGTTICVEI